MFRPSRHFRSQVCYSVFRNYNNSGVIGKVFWKVIVAIISTTKQLEYRRTQNLGRATWVVLLCCWMRLLLILFRIKNTIWGHGVPCVVGFEMLLHIIETYSMVLTRQQNEAFSVVWVVLSGLSLIARSTLQVGIRKNFKERSATLWQSAPFRSKNFMLQHKIYDFAKEHCVHKFWYQT